MASPFPGMDPYLEDPAIWPGLRLPLLSAIIEQLFRRLRGRYMTRLNERISPAGPGIFIHDRFIEIADLNDRSIVTVIELLSPTNKKANSYGRKSFLQKRKEVFASPAHWLEIDLLRRGKPTTRPRGVPRTAYRAYLSRAAVSADEFRKNFVWPMPLRSRLPIIGVPLRGGDPDVPLDLQTVLDAVVERGSYDLDFDYSRPPVPPLSPTDAAWARTLRTDDADSDGASAI